MISPTHFQLYEEDNYLTEIDKEYIKLQSGNHTWTGILEEDLLTWDRDE